MPSSPASSALTSGAPSGPKIIAKPPPGCRHHVSKYVKECGGISRRGREGTHGFREGRVHQLRLLFPVLRQHLGGNKHEACPFHGHELTRHPFSFSCDVVRPRNVFGFVPEWWPACDMDFYALRVFVVTEQRLEVLPAVRWKCQQIKRLAVLLREHTSSGRQLCRKEYRRHTLMTLLGHRPRSIAQRALA